MNITHYIFAQIGFFLAALICWILIKFSVNLGVRNLPKEEEIRWQNKKPSIGGLSFYISFLILFSFLSAYSQSHFPSDYRLELSLLTSCTVGFIIGLIDDARNTNPLLKLAGQIVCGLIIVSFGLTIPLSPNIVWNSIATVFWVVFLMNSINMLDNMDGMTTSICLFILFAITLYSGLPTNFYSIHIFSITGILIAFLYYNWHPSRIYMGDSGSQFLGVFIAHISIHYIWNERIDNGGYFQINQFFLPFLFFTIPIFDTATVFLHRILRRQSPFVGGKDHLSHALVYLGFKDWQSVLILCGIQIVFIALGMYVIRQRPDWIVMSMSLWLITFLGIQFIYTKAQKLRPTN